LIEEDLRTSLKVDFIVKFLDEMSRVEIQDKDINIYKFLREYITMMKNMMVHLILE